MDTMRRMRIWTYLKIAILSIAVELVAIVVTVIVGGAGHGSYAAARLFFPYTMLSGGDAGPIPTPFIVLACIQYLLYGFIWAMAVTYKNVAPVIFVLAAVHFSAVLLAFIFTTQYAPN